MREGKAQKNDFGSQTRLRPPVSVYRNFCVFKEKVFRLHVCVFSRNCYSSEIRTIENQAYMRYIVLDAGKRKKTEQNKQKKLCNFCGRSYIWSVSLLAQHPLREKKNWLKSISWQDSYTVNTRGVARWEDTRGDRKPLSFCSTGSLRFPFLRSFNLLWV